MKKIISLVLVLALTAIGGTLAYFTDTDQATNIIGTGVATDGKVDIKLIEQERGENGLQDFSQNKPLLPIVGSAQGEKDKFGMPTAGNYVDKIVNVQNLAEKAYIRVYVAIPAELDNTTEDTLDILHVNIGNRFNSEGKYNNTNYWDTEMEAGMGTYQECWGPETLVAQNVAIDGTNYNVYYYTYLKVVDTGATTNYAAIVGCYLDSDVDYDNDSQKYTINGTLIETNLAQIKIPVFAIGVQAAGFESANEALDAAFPNYNPWAAATLAP